MKTMKLILASAALFIAHLASAEMLYWMIGGENTIEFNYAVLYATKDGERFEVNNEIYGNQDLSSITTTGPILTEFGEGFKWSDYSYYVELLAWDGANESSVGVSEWATYDSLVSHGAIIPSGMGIPPTAQLWVPTINVPEPSSGLLVFVGFSLLALKRRRSVLAPSGDVGGLTVRANF